MDDNNIVKHSIQWRWSWIWISLAWALILTILSSIPGKSMPHWHVLSEDKLIHCLFYMPFGWTILSAFGRKYWFRFGFMMMIVMLYGGCDEVHQHFVPGRTMDVWDWSFDALGGAIGGSIFLMWEKRFPRG